MNLKQQDIYILLKVISLSREKWTYFGLSTDLQMSPSQTNMAVKRAIQCGLMRPGLGQEPNPQPIIAAVREFLAHGMRYAFPAQLGRLTRGVPTGFAIPQYANLLTNSEESVAVWPWSEGNYRGHSLIPLHRNAPVAVQKASRFHCYLALTDVLRQSSPRSRNIALAEFDSLIDHDA